MQQRIQQVENVQKNWSLYFVALRTTAEQWSYIRFICRIKRVSADFEQTTETDAFLNSMVFSWSAWVSMCHWAVFTYLTFWKNENIDGAPVSLVHIQSASTFAVFS